MPDGKVSWDIDIDANRRKQLDINQLLALYFRADKFVYQQSTGLPGLPDKKIEILHGKIAEFLTRGLLIQQLNRVKQETDKLSEQSFKSITTTQLFKLCQTLFATNLTGVIDDPEIAVFQYHENILLRPHQKIRHRKIIA